VQYTRERIKYYEVHHLEEGRIAFLLQQKSRLLPLQVLHSLELTLKYPLRSVPSPTV